MSYKPLKYINLKHGSRYQHIYQHTNILFTIIYRFDDDAQINKKPLSSIFSLMNALKKWYSILYVGLYVVGIYLNIIKGMILQISYANVRSHHKFVSDVQAAVDTY